MQILENDGREVDFFFSKIYAVTDWFRKFLYRVSYRINRCRIKLFLHLQQKRLGKYIALWN